MSGFNRRTFLAATAGAATLVATAGTRTHAAEDPAPPPQVPLGNTGITMSRVGQGTGMHGGNRQSDHSRMGFQRFVSLMRHSYDRGITFFDMADLYGTHVYFREALRTIPRDKITILTKLWWRYDQKMWDAGPAAIKQVVNFTLDRFRHELTTDYLDIVLLHCMGETGWPQTLAPYMDALDEAKDKKKIRAVGVSCHDLGALKTAAACPWVDVLLARINPKGAKMDGSVEEVVPVLQEAKANGKAIIGMKIFGEGTLIEQKQECIQYAQTAGIVDSMTIGFEKPEYVDDTLGLMSQYPVSQVGTGSTP
ncbi:MAG: aldo/keto reductase [Pirellulaceae bacterium]